MTEYRDLYRSRVPVQKETRDRLKEFQRGLGVNTMDAALNIALNALLAENETEVQAGFRIASTLSGGEEGEALPPRARRRGLPVSSAATVESLPTL